MDDTNPLEHIRSQAEESKTARAIGAILRRRESYFTDCGCSLEEARKSLFRDFPEARVLQVYTWGVVLSPKNMARVPTPPKGYAYKGGAARLALTHALGLEGSYKSARDLDLIRVTKEVDQIDEAIAQKIMGEDAQHGFGVESIRDFESYFLSRDITVNEVLYLDGRVVASHSAIEDTAQGNLRPSKYALEQNEDSRSRIAAKILRFAAERKLAGQAVATVQLPYQGDLPLFSFCLHLERALDQQGRLAETYCKQVAIHQMMPTELHGCKTLQDLKIEKLPKKFLKQFPNISRLNQKASSKKNTRIALKFKK